ncbi:MAG: hypothetical protein WBP59_00285 [Ilumatobacteraceae bacterium]
MGLFNKKSPMEKWRAQNKVAAAFVDQTGWEVDLATGVVHTVIEGTTVTVLLTAAMSMGAGGGAVAVIIEAGAQAERTLANTFGDDGGEAFEFNGWTGTVAPGSGLIDAHDAGGPALADKVVAAARALVARVNA